MPYRILITGAASGIGKAFVKEYLAKPNNEIYAVDLAFKSASYAVTELGIEMERNYRDQVGEQFAATNSSIIAFKGCDITSVEDIHLAFDKAPQTPLDLVIHSAGIRGLVPSVPITTSADVAKAETIHVMDSQTMHHAFNINVLGSFLFLRAILHWMQPRTGKIIVMGSRMGSIASNTGGGAFAYRASKAALNSIVKSFSVDAPELIFVTMHPGRVETSLVAVKEDGAISAAESVRDMLNEIEKLEISDSGRFIDRFGVDIPW